MRRDPDAVLAAAVRDELEGRVRAAAGTSVAADRRPARTLQAAAGVAAVLVVAWLALGLQGLAAHRPAPPAASASSTVLHGLTGAVQRSDGEIRGWAAARGLGAAVADRDVLVVRCMAAAGWRYDPIRPDMADATAHPGLTTEQWTAYQRALYGPPTAGAFDWRTAGCAGLALHETGQDGQD